MVDANLCRSLLVNGTRDWNCLDIEYFNSYKLLLFPRVTLEWFSSPGLHFSAFCISSLMSAISKRQGVKATTR